jgi:hypothetical protein
LPEIKQGQARIDQAQTRIGQATNRGKQADQRLAIAKGGLAIREKTSNPDYVYDKAKAQSEGTTEGKIEATRGAVLGPALKIADDTLTLLGSPDADKWIGAIKSSQAYQTARGQISSSTTVPAEWGKAGQNLVAMQAEADRALAGGMGAVTNEERKWLGNVSSHILAAPNAESAKALVSHYKVLIANLLTGPSSRDLNNSPVIQQARKEGLRSIERSLGGGAPTQTTPNPFGGAGAPNPFGGTGARPYSRQEIEAEMKRRGLLQ